MKKIFIVPVFLLATLSSFSNVRLPKIFGDNMVLQRNKQIPVWGWATANEKITVQLHTQIKTVQADADGKWMLRLDAESAGGPYQLSVSGENKIVVNNVLVGEVWICSGQSNMEMPIAGWGKINNYEQEIANANFPLIRHIKIPNTVNSTPLDDINSGEWKICNPQNAGDFTAAGYFFARELYNELKIPIGLINTSWGGTMVETWTSRSAFEQSDEFKNMIAQMPLLNLDSMGKMRAAQMQKKIEDMQGPFSKIKDLDDWKNISCDDSKWPHMQLPSLWEQKGLDGIDGVVWFRKIITVAAKDAGKEATLELSMIDDNDITYVNGVKVGAINSYNTKRIYNVPAGILKEGKNVIAVRVEDTGGGGGIYGDVTDMKITIGSTTQMLAGDWVFKVESVMSRALVGPNDYPTLLFNAMINPLILFAIEGAIWYQGEANAGRAYQYRKAFPLMITDWRQHWGQGDFPFYFVQLATFNAANGNSNNGSTWAELREAQTITLSLPNTGMAVTTDIGNPTDIHPKNKQDVGKRLAAIALHNVYAKENVCCGPTFESFRVAGNQVTISFTNIGSGLVAADKYGYLKGFEIAGDDKKFHYAKAFIQDDHIIVYCDAVRYPRAVRFGWADDAGEDNLFNKEGFPAAPFRTDDWKGITENQKYSIGN